MPGFTLGGGSAWRGWNFPPDLFWGNLFPEINGMKMPHRGSSLSDREGRRIPYRQVSAGERPSFRRHPRAGQDVGNHCHWDGTGARGGPPGRQSAASRLRTGNVCAPAPALRSSDYTNSKRGQGQASGSACCPSPGVIRAPSARGLLVFIWSISWEPGGGLCPTPNLVVTAWRRAGSGGFTCCGSSRRGVLTGRDCSW